MKLFILALVLLAIAGCRTTGLVTVRNCTNCRIAIDMGARAMQGKTVETTANPQTDLSGIPGM